uniref:Protein kinase domain-containing protein n=1 Tax=Heterorhabditis bacteriophora TaxID=37862 RepID=A0A1I7WTS5_HETBA
MEGTSITYRVKQIRDGRNFAIRYVEAEQHDKIIHLAEFSLQRSTTITSIEPDDYMLRHASLVYMSDLGLTQIKFYLDLTSMTGYCMSKNVYLIQSIVLSYTADSGPVMAVYYSPLLKKPLFIN